MSLRIEQGDSKDFGPCQCCGAMSRTVWGYVYRDGAAEAMYYVQWTRGEIERHGANFDLVIGEWGEGASRAARSAIALEFRQGQGFQVIDAHKRPIGEGELAEQILARSEVIGTPLADAAFEMVDAVWLQDVRIAEVRGVTG